MTGTTAPSRQPTALYVLALTEAWERFSYYGMRAILILYLTEHLLFPGRERWIAGMDLLRSVMATLVGPASDQAVSSQLYGLYTGLAYFTPVLGGVIADRWLGQRRSVIVGGLLMAAGQFALTRDSAFLLGLALLVVGNGLFKPNIVSQVGSLYAEGDTRRDRAYSIFYVSINIGACVSPLACGAVAQIYGWHAAFALGGFGMLLGLTIFLAGRKRLPTDNFARKRSIIVPSDAAEGRGELRSRIGFLTLLGILLSLFFMVFEQLGNAFSLWVRDNTDHVIAGYGIPVPWFQSANPLLMIALTPLLLMVWEGKAQRGNEKPTIIKISQGFALISFAYLFLSVVEWYSGEEKISWLFMIPFLVVLTWGELHISPTSLSLFSRIAPPRLISTMMGIYFLSTFVGNIAAGMLGASWSTTNPSRYWLIVGTLAGLGALSSVLLALPVNRFLARREIAL